MNITALPVIPRHCVEDHKDNVARILCTFLATDVCVLRSYNESDE
jgi:hypothetical protein